MDSHKFLICILFAMIFVSQRTNAQTLVAQRSQVTLPSNIARSAVAYDGNDTIYIFGGFRSGPLRESPDILEYRISTDTIRIGPVAQFPVPVSGGRVTHDGEGNYYYFGGRHQLTGLPAIYHFTPETNIVTELASFPAQLNIAGGFQINPSSTFIVGTSPTTATKIDLDRMDFSEGNQLFLDMRYTGVFWNGGEVAYIFGSYNLQTRPYSPIFRYNLTSGAAVLLEKDLPEMNARTATLVDDKFQFGWALGGFNPSHRMLRMNMETEETEMFQVDNLPGQTIQSFYDTAITYVDKLNRIYLFGGIYNTGVTMNWIYFIDLNSTQSKI